MAILSKLFGKKSDNISTLKTPMPHTPPSEKIVPSAGDFSFENVLQRYLTTDHSKVPSQYSYYKYYLAEFLCLLQNIPKSSIKLTDTKVLRNKEIRSPFETSSLITKRSNKGKLRDFVVVDVETTGIKPGGNDIIEVSAIKFKNFTPISVFTTLLKPRKPIPQEVTDITGISDTMVQDRPSFAQIRDSLKEYIADYPVVAHNAAFDVSFLFVSGLDFNENTKFYDTLELSRRHIKDYEGKKLDSYKLADVCGECCIYFDGAHRSFADALATGLLFIEIIKRVFETDNVLEF